MSDSGTSIVLAALRLIDGHILEAVNYNGPRPVTSQLDLDHYIHNDDGRLKWFAGGYSGTSSSEHLFGVGLLRASCKKRNGLTIKAEINLNDHIMINKAGRLEYF